LVHPSWGTYPPPIPNNRMFQPDLREARNYLMLDGSTDLLHLNFGWHDVERDEATLFRWTDEHASAFFRFAAPVHALAITLRGFLSTQLLKVTIRRPGRLAPEFELCLTTGAAWHTHTCSVDLAAGVYEVVLAGG